MKLKTVRKLKAQGNALVISLVICSILSLVVGYYLSLVDQQNMLSFRSMAWNSAIAVTEAGIEEGMAQLNSNASLGTAPWYASGSVYVREYTFANGNKYVATITPNPTDWVHPYSVTALATVNPNGSGMIAALGLPTTQPNVNRAVRVYVTRGNLLIKGMVARHSIVMNGNGVMTDSYDSTDPAWSTAGQYDSTKTRANGDIAVNDAITNAVSGGNANIYGHVNTGPGGTISVGSNGGVGDQAWVAAHPGGIEPGYTANNANFTFPETDLPYTTGLTPATNITVVLTNYFLATNGQTVTSATLPNPIPYGGVLTNISTVTSTILPNPVPAGLTTNCGNALVTSAGLPAAGTYCGTPTPASQGVGNGVKWTYYPLNGYSWPVYSYTWGLYTTNFTVTTNQYDNVLYSGDYVMDTLSGKTLVLGNARLVVKNGINMTGNDVLEIAQTGSLLAYADGTSSKITGNGILNDNSMPANCQIYFTKNTTDLQIGGNGTIAATIIAPDANVTMNGGGRANTDYMGAIMGSTINLNGHFSFHYDESLGKRGATGRYIVSTWDEIKPGH